MEQSFSHGCHLISIEMKSIRADVYVHCTTTKRTFRQFEYLLERLIIRQRQKHHTRHGGSQFEKPFTRSMVHTYVSTFYSVYNTVESHMNYSTLFARASYTARRTNAETRSACEKCTRMTNTFYLAIQWTTTAPKHFGFIGSPIWCCWCRCAMPMATANKCEGFSTFIVGTHAHIHTLHTCSHDYTPCICRV